MGKTENYKRLTVTAALPYANGYIHLGHIAGAYLPADMYVRYQKLSGRDVIFICGSDENGTAIEMTALKEGVTPQEIIDTYHFSNKKAFEDLGIKFDIYSRTSHEIHTKTAQEFFLTLFGKGILYPKTEKQLFSVKENRFLADRYVEGTCPVCGYEEARGDQCENCGTNLSPLELINPRSKVTGDTPIVKDSTQLYFPLSKFQKQLEDWIGSKNDWKANVKNYCNGWFKTGLKDRAVTRDLEWGVKVPLEEYKNKIIYVWIEAPVGYISATKELFIERGEPDGWEKYWKNDQTRLIHFLGKDNIIFHSIVFPAMIMAHGDFILPDNVPANEYLNFEGGKFSKSKGHGDLVKDAVKIFNPDSIRYSIASSLPENRDSDFTWKDLQSKNNNELGAIFGNFVNRTFVFAEKYFEGKVPALNKLEPIDEDIMGKLKAAQVSIAEYYGNFRFKDAVSETMNIVRDANKYFNDAEPWKAIKENKERCETIINICLQLVHSFAILFSPILPFTSEKILQMLNVDRSNFKWEKSNELCLKAGYNLNKPEILFSKIEDDQLEMS
jgi:methionyl-tRNA synthetase